MRFSAALTLPLPMQLRARTAEEAARLFEFAPQALPTDDELRSIPMELPLDLDQRVRAIGEW